MHCTPLKLHALEEQTEHALIVLDPEGVVTEWDAAATKLFGYTRDEMMGKTLHVLFTPEDLERGELDNELRSAASCGRGDDDRWMVRKDSSSFWASGVVTAVRGHSGQPVAYLKVVRDRTDVRGQIDALQNRLQAMRNEASEKNVLLATLAHELSNPLAALRQAAQAIQIASRSFNSTLEGLLAIINRQATFMEKLIRDLADFARASEGRLSVELQPMDLRAVIDRALETCGPGLWQRGQTVEVLASEPITLEADAVRLQQVLVNLLVNASKFSPIHGKIWIRVTVEGNEAVIHVEDKGTGITPEFLPQMFELFTRAGASTRGRRAEDGMGLGLALVKRLVELHGGTVQAKSEGSGKGTELTVRLPLKAEGSRS